MGLIRVTRLTLAESGGSKPAARSAGRGIPAAIAGALDETSLPDGAFMTTRPYSAEQLQDREFFPD